MTRPDDLMPLFDEAVRTLDIALGPRACGAVVSGCAVLGFKFRESPHTLTKRTLVMPVMDAMGYGGPRYDLDSLDGRDGLLMAMVPMNRPLDDPIRQALAFMRGHGTELAIATDGFRWMLLDVGRFGPRVGFRADLRPFYVEALDRNRFKNAVPADRGEIERFIGAFGKDGSVGSVLQGIAQGDDLHGEGFDRFRHLVHELVVILGHRGALGRGDDDALLLHDLQGVSHAVLRYARHLGQADQTDRLVVPDGAEDGYVALQEFQVLAQRFYRVLWSGQRHHPRKSVKRLG